MVVRKGGSVDDGVVAVVERAGGRCVDVWRRWCWACQRARAWMDGKQKASLVAPSVKAGGGSAKDAPAILLDAKASDISLTSNKTQY